MANNKILTVYPQNMLGGNSGSLQIRLVVRWNSHSSQAGTNNWLSQGRPDGKWISTSLTKGLVKQFHPAGSEELKHDFRQKFRNWFTKGITSGSIEYSIE